MKRIILILLAVLLLAPLAAVHALAAPAADTITRWHVTPTPLIARGEPALQNIDLAIEAAETIDACSLRVWSGGKLLAERSLGALKSGTNQVSVLLPEPATVCKTRWALCNGDAILAEQAVTWMPPRHWTIYEVFSSHVDIGLHEPQYKQRHMCSQLLDRAQELLEATAADPDASRFRYVVEGLWWWGNYERDRSEQAARRLIENYAKPGLIGIGASHSGNRTEVFSTEELCRSAYYARELRYRWGLAADTMLMVDNNGITWPLVTAYADAGIKYLGFYPNPWNPDAVNCWKPGGTPGSRIDVGWESPLPHLFYWQGPDRKRRILVWSNLSYGSLSSFSFGHDKSDPKAMAPIMAKQLALAESRYPYDVWMLPNYDDNQAPGLGAANRAKAWNAIWRWPELRTTGDLSVPFKDVEKRFGDRIPTLSGLMTAGWAQHPVATPSLLAGKFAADRLLPTAEKLATLARLTDPTYVYPVNEFRRAWDALICNDEHGYGVSSYKGRPVYDTWMQKRDWIAQASKTAVTESSRALPAIAKNVPATSPAVLVFNPTLQPRRETVEVELPVSCAGLFVLRAPSGETATAEMNGHKIRFRTPAEIPSLGYVVFPLERGAAATVVATSIPQPPVAENSFYRIKFDDAGAITSIFDKQLERELIDAKAPYRCNQLVYSKDRNKTFASPTGARFAMETSALGQTVIATLDDPNTKAEIIQRVSLPAHEKRIDIDNRLNHVRDLGNIKRWDRFGYFAFPFAVSNGEFRVGLNGCHARSYADQTGLTTDTYHAARDWAHVGNGEFGVALIQQDSQLIECGKLHADKRTFGQRPETSHLYSYAFTDWLYAHAYETGPSHINLRFRYSILSHAGSFEGARVPQFADRTVTPLLTAVLPQAQAGTLPPGQHSFLSVDAPNLELLTLKLSEEPGRGVVARFHETEGKQTTQTNFRLGFGQPQRSTKCSLLERNGSVLEKPTLACDAFGYFTLRLEQDSAEPATPAPAVVSVTDRSVDLKWPPVPNAAQYYVYRGEEARFAADEYHLLAITCEAAFRDNGLSAGATNYYRVAAVNAGAQQGAISAAVQAVTAAKGDSPPAKVGSHYTGLISAPRAWRGDTSDMLYLQWGQNRESDVSHYELHRGEKPDFVVGPASLIAKVQPGPYAVVPCEDKGLKTHSTYYYRVLAVDRDGHASEPSDVFEGTTREPPENEQSK